MRTVLWAGVFAGVVGCNFGRWNGEVLDVVAPAFFTGPFDADRLNHGLEGDASLEVAFFPCGDSQCAEFSFDGTLRSERANLYGPRHDTIRDVTIDHPHLWSQFELSGYDVRVEGEFQDRGAHLWLDIQAEIPPFGFINVGEIVLDVVSDDPLPPSPTLASW